MVASAPAASFAVKTTRSSSSSSSMSVSSSSRGDGPADLASATETGTPSRSFFSSSAAAAASADAGPMLSGGGDDMDGGFGAMERTVATRPARPQTLSRRTAAAAILGDQPGIGKAKPPHSSAATLSKNE